MKACALYYVSLTSTRNLQDDFNLTGLNILVPYYDYALDMVLDVEMPMEDSLTEEQQEIVESAAVRVCFVLRRLWSGVNCSDANFSPICPRKCSMG